jgi:hypothetical protein
MPRPTESKMPTLDLDQEDDFVEVPRAEWLALATGARAGALVSNATDMHVLLVVALLCLANSDGWTAQSSVDLGIATGRAVGHVRESIHRLERNGLIVRQRRVELPSRLYFNPSVLVPETATGAVKGA